MQCSNGPNSVCNPYKAKVFVALVFFKLGISHNLTNIERTSIIFAFFCFIIIMQHMIYVLGTPRNDGQLKKKNDEAIVPWVETPRTEPFSIRACVCQQGRGAEHPRRGQRDVVA